MTCLVRAPPSDWAGWEAYDEAKAAAYLDAAAHAEEVGYYYWLQFVLDRQLQAVRSYAEERGVFLKGASPSGVAPPQRRRLDGTASLPHRAVRRRPAR